MALPPDDFQLFGTIFFVLLAIGLVLSVAFASALYFFHWYGRKKNGQQQMGENKAEIPIQWISYRGEGIGYNEKTIPSSQQFYSPYQQNDEEGRNAPRDHSKLLKKSFKELFADLVESIGRGCRILVSYLPGHGLSSSPSPSHTIFPTTMTIMRPPPSSPPSYISAQSPELVHFPKWANDAPKQLPSENSGKKLPKGILKKPKIHLNGNGGMPRPTMKRPPILMPMPIRRGTQSEIGRKPPPIPSQWKWNVKLEDGDHCERVVEDRIEREESCVQGKLVSIERVSRTTTTTKMLKEEATKMERRRRMEDWPNSEKTIFI